MIIATICWALMLPCHSCYSTYLISLLQQKFEVVIMHFRLFGNGVWTMTLTEDILESVLKIVLIIVFKRRFSLVVCTASTNQHANAQGQNCFKNKRLFSTLINTNVTLYSLFCPCKGTGHTVTGAPDHGKRHFSHVASPKFH